MKTTETHPFHLQLARDAGWPLVTRDAGWPLVTRDGRKAEVLIYTRDHIEYPLAGMVENVKLRVWTAGGKNTALENYCEDLFLSADYTDPDVRAAVQRAHEELKMEVKFRHHSTTHFTRDISPYWNSWAIGEFRLGIHVPVPVSPIAPGHNPDKLTVDQVGEGWRLVEFNEGHGKSHSPAWFLATEILGLGTNWLSPLVASPAFNFTWDANILRTRLSREELAKLDAPEPQYWDCAEDVPGPVCWIHSSKWGKDTQVMIVHIIDHGVFLGNARYIEFAGIQDYEHSTDRKTWLPCVKGGK